MPCLEALRAGFWEPLELNSWLKETVSPRLLEIFMATFRPADEWTPDMFTFNGDSEYLACWARQASSKQLGKFAAWATGSVVNPSPLPRLRQFPDCYV